MDEQKKYSIGKTFGVYPGNLGIILEVIEMVNKDRGETKLAKEGAEQALSILKKSYPNSLFEIVER